jgi:hypothetical protein
MKITRRQLRQLIKEAIEVHQVPDNLENFGPEEAYGVGYIKGTEQDTNTEDDGFSGTVELVDPTCDIADDTDAKGQSINQMPASWQQILRDVIGNHN